MPDRDSFARWVAKQQTDLREGEDPISAYALFHVIEEEGMTAFASVEKADEKSVESIVETLWETAENDADTRVHGMPQRYVVTAHRSPDEVCARMAFVLTGHGIIEETMREASSKPPTEKGITSQMMHHAEQSHRMMVGFSEATVGKLVRENDRLYARTEKLEARHMATVLAAEELADRKVDRDIKIREYERGRDREEKVWEVLLSLAPLLAQKLLPDAKSAVLSQILQGQGQEVVEGGVTEDGDEAPEPSELIVDFVKRLRPDELQKVLAAVGPEKAAELAKIYQSVQVH